MSREQRHSWYWEIRLLHTYWKASKWERKKVVRFCVAVVSSLDWYFGPISFTRHWLLRSRKEGVSAGCSCVLVYYKTAKEWTFFSKDIWHSSSSFSAEPDEHLRNDEQFCIFNQRRRRRQLVPNVGTCLTHLLQFLYTKNSFYKKVYCTM